MPTYAKGESCPLIALRQYSEKKAGLGGKRRQNCLDVLLAAPKNVVKMGGDGPYSSAIFAKKSTGAARTKTPGIAIRL